MSLLSILDLSGWRTLSEKEKVAAKEEDENRFSPRVKDNERLLPTPSSSPSFPTSTSKDVSLLAVAKSYLRLRASFWGRRRRGELW